MPANATAWRPLMNAVGLPDAADWPVWRLSSGERQRLSIVRALARRPSVLLLDEPTANLDADRVSAVEDLIRRALNDGAGIILTSHDPAQIDRLANDRIALCAGHMESSS